MGLSYRPAKRSEAKPLIGLYAESGCGKTKSALLLARGFAGPEGKVAMIETESGRGEVYEDEIPGGYDVISLRGDYSPEIYGQAITLAEKNQVDVLIIDSASHEWEGLGGVLDMAAKNQEGGKKGPLVWQKPKMDHQKHFVGRLMQTSIRLVIVCMRAKYPMVEGVNPKNNKREWHRSEDLSPKQSDDLLFELMIHGWIDRDHKFHGTKYTREETRNIIPSGEVISIETGARLASWANGNEAANDDRAPEFFERIRTAATPEDLSEIGAEIKAANVSSSARAELRSFFAQKLQEVSA